MSAPNSITGKLLGNVSDLPLSEIEADVPIELDFLNFDWYLAWEESYLPIEDPGLSLSYITLEDEQKKIQGVCPFIIKSQLGMKLFSLAGYYYPFRSIIASKSFSSACSQVLVQTLQESKIASLVRIGPAEESSPITKKLYSAFTSNGWNCYSIDRGEQYFLHLPKSFEEYKNSISKKLRGNLRRDLKKLKKLGDVQFVKYNALEQEDWERVINDCSNVESNSWLMKASDGKARIYNKEKFWNRLLENKNTSERTTVWIMYLNDKPIAYNLVIDSGKYRYGVSSQYDLDYRSYSVGLSTYTYVIEDAINMGIKVFNMGDSDSGFKKRWGAVPGPRLVDYIYFKPDILGTVLYTGLNIKDRIVNILETCTSKFKKPLFVSLLISLTRTSKN